jgi:hypothetical protein
MPAFQLIGQDGNPSRISGRRSAFRLLSEGDPAPVPPFSRAPFTNPALLFSYINPLALSDNPITSWLAWNDPTQSAEQGNPADSPTVVLNNRAQYDGASDFLSLNAASRATIGGLDDFTLLIAVQRLVTGNTEYIFRADGAGGNHLAMLFQAAGDTVDLHDDRPGATIVAGTQPVNGVPCLLSGRFRRNAVGIVGKGGTYEAGTVPADNAPIGAMTTANLGWIAFFLHAEVMFCLGYSGSLSDAVIDGYRADLSNTLDFGTLGVTL